MRVLPVLALACLLAAPVHAQAAVGPSANEQNIIGDFDGDGKLDTAQLTITGASRKLVARISSKNNAEFSLGEGEQKGADDELRTELPGDYLAVAPKRGDPPVTIKLPNGGIGYTASQQPEMIFWWNGKDFSYFVVAK